MQEHHLSLMPIVGLLALLGIPNSRAGARPWKAAQSAPEARHETRFTAPPGQETDTVRKQIDAAEAAARAGTSATDLLIEPSLVPAHEYPRFRKVVRESAASARTTIVTSREPGTPLMVAGRVVDTDGKPVKGAVIYAYQTSAEGWYSDRAAHYSGVEGDRKHARLFGFMRTDAGGRFELRTIRPAGYPNSDLPAHIHIEISKAAGRPATIVTEIQFDDDPRLTGEWRRRSRQDGFHMGKINKEAGGLQRVDVEFRMR